MQVARQCHMGMDNHMTSHHARGHSAAGMPPASSDDSLCGCSIICSFSSRRSWRCLDGLRGARRLCIIVCHRQLPAVIDDEQLRRCARLLQGLEALHNACSTTEQRKILLFSIRCAAALPTAAGRGAQLTGI